MVEVSGKDKKELEELAKQHKAETAQIWYSRMKWQDGHEKLITFGAAVDVRRADGTSKANGLYCYECKITDEKAEYKGIPISWEKWGNGIKFQVDDARHVFRRLMRDPERQKNLTEKGIKKAIIAMYYQQIINEHGYYLTLPKAEIDEIKAWIYQYFKDGKAAFPYQGEIPNADVNFTIDFKRDVEIVGAFDLSEYNRQHNAERNKKHNAKHNKELGRKRVFETFSRLTGNEWTRAEILAQRFNQKNLDNFVKYELIERVKQGHYKRKDV